MKKIVVIGCKGMAGHVIKRYLEETNLYEVWGIARGKVDQSNMITLDVSYQKELEVIIQQYSFDIVINCIGILNNSAEDNPEIAIWFNSYFPHKLASLGKKFGFNLIHISTDCVFSGKKGGYTEISPKDGKGMYAQSKALGEIIDNKDLTIRTSIIGPELNPNGIGLFHWFMSQNTEITGFEKVFWTGVTTLELGKGIDQAIKQNLTGLYHFVNNTKISKLNLLKLLNIHFRNNEILINPDYKFKSNKSLICTRNDFHYKVPSYNDMIIELKEWMLMNKSVYSYYKNRFH